MEECEEGKEWYCTEDDSGPVLWRCTEHRGTQHLGRDAVGQF